MANDITTDDSGEAAGMEKPVIDDSLADPVAVVLMLQREAGNRRQEGNRLSTPRKQARIKERLLRRMLENSLECMDQPRKPHLKIIK